MGTVNSNIAVNCNAEQLNMSQYDAYIESIRNSLLQLGWKDDFTLCHRYTGCEKVSQIPKQRLAEWARKLSAEAKCLELMGRKHFDESRTMAAKLRLYQNALDDMRDSVIANELGDNEVCWTDFKNRLSSFVVGYDETWAKNHKRTREQVSREQEAAVSTGCGC